MHTLHIPQVSLVDAYGKYLGYYKDQPDWWQNVQLNQKKSEEYLKDFKNTFLTSGGSTTDLKARLINEAEEKKVLLLVEEQNFQYIQKMLKKVNT